MGYGKTRGEVFKISGEGKARRLTDLSLRLVV